jgi:hypothetical protein
MGTEPATWTQRLVQVPVWALLAIGAAIVGGGGAAVAGIPKPDATSVPAEMSEIRASLQRIEGTAEGMARVQAQYAAEMVSLRREVNTLRADVDALQRTR